MGGPGRVTTVIVVLLGALAAPASALADGELDPSFGSGGTVVTDLVANNGGEGFADLALLPDGRILGGGNAGGNGFGLIRYLANGAFDPSFGSDGKFAQKLYPGGYSAPTAIALRPDGRAVVSGFGGPNPATYDSLVAQLTDGGALDPSFGNDPPNPAADGFDQFDNGAGVDDLALGTAVDAAGRVLIAGRFGSNMVGGPNDIYVERLNQDGSPDASFNGSGIVTLNPGVDDGGSDVRVLADGSILVAAIVNRDFSAIKLTPSGALDPSFGNSGIATLLGTELASGTLKMTVQPDGRILLSGTGKSGSDTDALVARLNPDGSRDSSFSGDGVQTVSVGDSMFAGQTAVADDGRIVFGGTAQFGSDYRALAIRLLPNGELDGSFGSGGFVTQGSPGFDYSVGAVEVQTNRRILLGGSDSDATHDDYLLLRLLGDTQPPDTAITKAPKKKITPRNKVSLSFEQLNDVHSTFECKLQRPRHKKRHAHHRTAPATFKSCTSPVSYKGVRRLGKYTFSVRATDPAGNTDPTPAARKFRVRKRHH